MTPSLAYSTPAAVAAFLPDVDYFKRPEVSNSDLSWLKLTLLSTEEQKDFTNAYRMGTLIDAMITEPHLIDYYKFTCNGEQYTREEFALCELMKKAFRNDEFCTGLLRQSTGQKVFSGNVQFNYCGVVFSLLMRCKYDLWSDILRWGGDIKSTTATSQKQFEEAVRYFDYDRQRVGYMEQSGASRDMIIGISKVNFKIFKVPVMRGSDLWQSGMDKLNDLAFRWYCLFEDTEQAQNLMIASHDKEHDIIIVEGK
jgi:hypothetical protein